MHLVSMHQHWLLTNLYHFHFPLTTAFAFLELKTFFYLLFQSDCDKNIYYKKVACNISVISITKVRLPITKEKSSNEVHL